jgi:cullin 3
MRKAEHRLSEEHERASHYLDRSSEPRLKEVVERELIAAHMRTLAEMPHSGVVPMMDDDRIEDLRRAYELFRRVRALLGGLGVGEIWIAGLKVKGQKVVGLGLKVSHARARTRAHFYFNPTLTPPRRVRVSEVGLCI